MSNIVRRVLTALVFVPLILWLLYLGPIWAFVGFVATATGIASWEFFGLTHGNDPLGRAVGTTVTLGFYLLAIQARFGAIRASMGIAVLLLTLTALLFTLLRPARIPNALIETGALTLGPLYVGGMMATLPVMLLSTERRKGAGLVVFTLMIAWLSDTAGLAFGKMFKGPKLYPAVSPNKTWSGAVGGLLGSSLGAVLAHFIYLPELSLLSGIAVALAAGAVGQLGDLAESVLKRSAGVKDSGGILPGHGGFLDRIDALTFSAVVVYCSLRFGALTLS